MSGTPQTVILPYGQPVAIAGLATDSILSWSAVNKDPNSYNIAPGIGVTPDGSTQLGVMNFSANTQKLAGVASVLQVYGPGSFGGIDQGSTTKGYRPNVQFPLLLEGLVWVVMDGDATVTPNVSRGFVRFQSDGVNNTLIGAFRTAQDGGTNCIDVTTEVLFKSPIVSAADVLTGGTVKICLAYISTSNK